MDNNRFAPPTAEIADLSEPRGLQALSRVALIGIALQLLFAGLYAPVFFKLVSVGAFSLLHFLLFTVSTALLITGGLKLLRKTSSATFWIGASSFLALLSLLQSKPLISITGAFISVLAAFASSRQFNARTKFIPREPQL